MKQTFVLSLFVAINFSSAWSQTLPTCYNMLTPAFTDHSVTAQSATTANVFFGWTNVGATSYKLPHKITSQSTYPAPVFTSGGLGCTVSWRNILFCVVGLLMALSITIYCFLQYRGKKYHEVLNHKLDQLATRQKVTPEKHINALQLGGAQAIESVDDRFVKKVIELIEIRMDDHLFGVEQLSREIGMTRSTMTRKLKTLTGYPPSELIRNIRLKKAAKLILNQVDSISQICFMVGIGDHSYFSKLFKKQYGVRPSKYLQSRRQLN